MCDKDKIIQSRCVAKLYNSKISSNSKVLKAPIKQNVALRERSRSTGTLVEHFRKPWHLNRSKTKEGTRVMRAQSLPVEGCWERFKKEERGSKSDTIVHRKKVGDGLCIEKCGNFGHGKCYIGFIGIMWK